MVWIKFSYISYVQWKPLSHEHNIFQNYVYCFATNLIWDERLGVDVLSGSAWSCLLKLKVFMTDVFYLHNGIYMGYWHENQKSWIQFFHSLHLVIILQKSPISLLVGSDKTRGGGLGLFCLWCQKKNAFPWFSCFSCHVICFSGKDSWKWSKDVSCMAAAMWKTTRKLFSFLLFLLWHHGLTSPRFPPRAVSDPTVSEISFFWMTKMQWIKNYIKLSFDFFVMIPCRFLQENNKIYPLT